MPKVSIIVPIYNVEKYLPKCMETLLNQTLSDIEIILVDDGSPDGSPAMCDEYAKKDSRIKVIHKQNAGLGFARNSGLEVATGEFVAFVDSDDYVDVTMYEKLYAKAYERQADVVFCGLKRVWEDGRTEPKSDVTEETLCVGENVKELALDFIAPAPGIAQERLYEMSVWHSIYKRELIEKNNIRFNSEREIVSEDLPFQVDFFSSAKKVCFIPDVLYCYRMDNGGSLTKAFNIKKFYGTIKLYGLMRTKTQTIDETGLRAKRLFIAYNRTFCKQTAKGRISFADKMETFSNMTNDPIWQEMKEYKYTYLPLYARIYLFLQRNRCNLVLYAYSYLIGTIK